jgi:ATP-dependent Lon protease
MTEPTATPSSATEIHLGANLPPGVVPIVPMRNLVLFPQVLAPITIGRPRSVAAVARAVGSKDPLIVVLQRDPSVDDPGLVDLHPMGTLARIVQHARGDESQWHVVCQGVARVRVMELVPGHPFMAGRIERIPEEEGTRPSAHAEALSLQLRERTAELLSLLPSVPAELAQVMQATTSPAHLADLAASLVDAEPEQKQVLLETLDPELRLRGVLDLVTHRLHAACCCRSRCAPSARSWARKASNRRSSSGWKKRLPRPPCRTRPRPRPARSSSGSSE